MSMTAREKRLVMERSDYWGDSDMGYVGKNGHWYL